MSRIYFLVCFIFFFFFDPSLSSKTPTSIIDDYEGIKDVINKGKFSPVTSISSLNDYKKFVYDFETYKKLIHKPVTITPNNWIEFI